MARIRSIKPEFWGDRKLAAKVSRDARLLYIALWNQADEHARLQGDARWVKGHCLPYDDDLNLQAVDSLIDELEAAGRVQRYSVDGDPYLFLPKLGAHQRLEPSKVPSRLPEPPDLSETAGQSPGAMSSEPRTDESAPRADETGTSVALQVAGSRWQVAGGRDMAPAKPTRAPRTQDPIWDALLDACAVEPTTVTSSSRGAYNRAVADLRAVAASPAEIHHRAGIFRERWPDASLTPTALARRWAECATDPPRRLSPAEQRMAGHAALIQKLAAEESP